VLDTHRVRNKPNNPPSAEQLLDAGRHQLDINNEGGEDHKSDDEEEDEDEDEDNPTSKRAIRHSKSDRSVKPTTAKYYDGTAWKMAIIQAKVAFRRYVMLQYLFPVTDPHLEEAELILSKMVTDLKQKVSFSSGEVSFNCLHFMLIPL
jgi:hypothetical protein